MEGANLLTELTKQVAVFTVVAFVFSQSPLHALLETRGAGRRGGTKLGLFLFFCAVAIMGTHLGVEVQGALANSRAVGAVLAGLYGGPLVGFGVGLVAGLERYSLGGFTNLACALSTVVEGVLGGAVAWWLGTRRAVQPHVAFTTTFIAEIAQMAIILLIARPWAQAVSLVYAIGGPMIVMNAVGVWLFTKMVDNQQKLRWRFEDRSTALALDIAQRAVSVLGRGFDRSTAAELAATLSQHLPVGAVAVTDRSTVLAFNGLGMDHHRVGDPVDAVVRPELLDEAKVHFIDGQSERFSCAAGVRCPLRCALVVPLALEDEVVGSIVLFEPEPRTFRETHRSFGVRVGELLSDQLLRNRVEEQRKLLFESELKLVRAQINPHFLFNALNVILAVIRENPARARQLVANLSNFMRTNLKRAESEVTLSTEMDHVNDYLELERARFGERICFSVDIPDDLADLRVPTFTVQPLVENAIKHGVRDLMEDGEVRIRARKQEEQLVIDVEDNGGNFDEGRRSTDGMGLSLVHRRIQLSYGTGFGAFVHCEPGVLTQVRVRLPVRAIS